MTEDNLSDYKNVMRIEGKAVVVYPEKDVKKFIKKLKERLFDKGAIKIINELAGENLLWQKNLI